MFYQMYELFFKNLLGQPWNQPRNCTSVLENTQKKVMLKNQKNQKKTLRKPSFNSEKLF